MGANEIYEQALQHYSSDSGFRYESEHLAKYPSELIYCYEHDIPFNHFQDWAKLQDLLYEKTSYDDYLTIAAAFSKINLQEVDSNDLNTVGEMRYVLRRWHEADQVLPPPVPSFAERMRSRLNRLLGRKETMPIVEQESPYSHSYPTQQYSKFNPEYLKAKRHFSKDFEYDIDKYYSNHRDELVYCYKHGESFVSFEIWCQYQDVLGEKISFEEADILHAGTRHSIFTIDPQKDIGYVYELHHYVDLIRNNAAKEKTVENPTQDRSSQNTPQKKAPIDNIIQNASERAGKSQSDPHVKTRTSEPER